MVTSKKNATPLLDQLLNELAATLVEKVRIQQESTPDTAFLSRSRAAKYLDVHPSLINRFVREGKLHPVRTSENGNARYRIAELNSIFQE